MKIGTSRSSTLAQPRTWAGVRPLPPHFLFECVLGLILVVTPSFLRPGRTNSFEGTPEYMSPELLGDQKELDTRCALAASATPH
jgi:serine/threonine protein kinase